MPCGCSGGTWTPPDAQTGAAKPGVAVKPQPVKTVPGAVGPAAPGYFHGPDR